MNMSGPKATPDVPAPNGGDAVVTPIAYGEAGSVTPMMRQYQEIKAAIDSMLFLRMGDSTTFLPGRRYREAARWESCYTSEAS